jgi:Flp pilus assembly protein TadD
VALAVVPAAYVLHSLADYDLDFLATTGVAAFALGVLGAAGRPEATARRPLWGIAAVATAVVAIGSLASPRLAESEVEDALSALERGDYEAAVDHTESARDLDPFSLDPIFTRAQLESARGDRQAARQAYFDAARLQPENPEPWLELGRFEFALGRLCSAYRYLNQAYTLDPAGREWSEGGELDEARAHVNSGACSR